MTFIREDGGIFNYTIEGSTVKILNPRNEEVLRCNRNPMGGDWTEKEQKEWGSLEVLTRNFLLAKELVDSKISEVSKAYDNAMVSRVTLSDGNVFGPSKSAGLNPTFSLQNTIDLIRAGCEQSVFRCRPSITISDADNKEVTYTFDFDSKFPAYILPVVEIADYIAIIFSIKQTLRSRLMGMLADGVTEFSFDEVNYINGEILFNNTLRDTLSKLKK